MHVGQIIIVTGEDEDEARGNVESSLSESPSWSDWHNASGSGSFAGRWEGEFFGKDNAFDTLRYSDNPELAETVIAERLASRVREMDELRSHLADFSLLTADYDPYTRSENMLQFWRYEKLAKLLNDEWVPESYIYDLEAWDAGLRYFRERVTEAPESQWLVAVDFHF